MRRPVPTGGHRNAAGWSALFFRLDLRLAYLAIRDQQIDHIPLEDQIGTSEIRSHAVMF